ncbi:MAG TPA: hypothetical protein VIY53_20825 [Acidobacteriaceae bacterium]
MRVRILGQAMIVGALLSIVGCHVQVDKGKNGEDKNVKIDTPVGGLHVRADQTSASDLGLPVYPGAQVVPDNEGDKSADVHMGFGKWQLHIRVVTYQSADPQDKVLAFYKNALGRYGDVLECDGKQPVGTPTMTSEGLTCKEENHVHVNNGPNSTPIEDSGLSLRAGSQHHQHILAFKTASAGTKFTMVEMQLPGGLDDKSGKPD